jgi:Lysine methyltransferase
MKDTTGYGIWSASIIMAQWMTDLFHGKNHGSSSTIHNPWTKIRTIVELGAGCGVPGMTIAKSIALSTASATTATNDDDDDKEVPGTKVYLTDLNPTTVSNLQHNIQLNQLHPIAYAVTMDWQDLEDSSKIWPWTTTTTTTTTTDGEEQVVSDSSSSSVDVLIGSDLVYQREAVPSLIQTILRLSPRRFYYGAGKNRDGHEEFISTLQQCDQFTLVASYLAPKSYRTNNPLLNQDDDECFIHFHDLLFTDNAEHDEDDAFTLYEFVWNVIPDKSLNESP